MIDYREDPVSNVVEITVDGKISRAEFDEIAGKLEAHIAKHGKVHLLEEIRSFGGMEMSLYWDDLKFSLRHLSDFSRCAVVADKTWIEWMAKAANPFVACDIKVFEPGQIDEARGWLKEDAKAA